VGGPVKGGGEAGGGLGPGRGLMRLLRRRAAPNCVARPSPGRPRTECTKPGAARTTLMPKGASSRLAGGRRGGEWEESQGESPALQAAVYRRVLGWQGGGRLDGKLSFKPHYRAPSISYTPQGVCHGLEGGLGGGVGAQEGEGQEGGGGADWGGGFQEAGASAACQGGAHGQSKCAKSKRPGLSPPSAHGPCNPPPAPARPPRAHR
jgi:hypothetical protein